MIKAYLGVLVKITLCKFFAGKYPGVFGGEAGGVLCVSVRVGGEGSLQGGRAGAALEPAGSAASRQQFW